LMEIQGPEQYRDAFTKEILRFNRGGIVSSHPWMTHDQRLWHS